MTDEEQKGYNEALDRIEKAYKQKSTGLDLSRLGLTQLPKTIGKLTQLTSLNLFSNQLKTLPEEIDKLTQLTFLNLSSNLLRILPEEIVKLTQLTKLYLWSNHLITLPQELGNLTQLKRLYVYNNQLETLPQELGNLTQLIILFIYNNQLKTLPEGIGNLTQLIRLKVNINKLATLPNEIGGLNKLDELDVSDNELTTIPNEICRLTKLTVLNISNNKLTTLPNEIGTLRNLIYFNLPNNELKTLPESMRKLDNLDGLYLHGNMNLELPKAILGASWNSITDTRQPAKPKDILDYYFKILGGKKPLNEAKLILVGRGEVGKTSLVNRLIDNIFNPKENKTDGIKISGWKLKLNQNEDVRLNIWDFGGQEIMHATHQFFLTERSLYLLVLNGREGGEDADAEYWLKLISSFASDSPVIIVMNKIKQHQFDLNRRGLQQKYHNIYTFIKTDCEDGTGIEELKEIIHAETDKLDHLRDAFPSAWFDIKEKLAVMKENYLLFNQYQDFCSRNGEKDEEAQIALAGYLHNLGIALNYKDDPRLRDAHILNPIWLTTGIYKILNSEKLANQYGVLTLDDILGVLDKIDYPQSMHNFLLDLMKKFELCFTFSETDNHYLIPELLPKEEPIETGYFKPEECLNFQYHYTVLPEGLLPRFIVRTHILSEGLQRWRTGVILEFEGCKALVKADIQDKKVFISVSGKGEARRRLLGVIRSDFEQIHNDIKNLQPEEMVPLPKDYKVVVPYSKLTKFENKGIKTFNDTVGDDIAEINVEELLNGVDLHGVRWRRGLPIKIFYSYSHKDESLCNELVTHLKLMQRQGIIEQWYDRKIVPGEKWESQIDENLEKADIILLLISADFNASDYCSEIELSRALEREEKGEVVVIPVIIRDVSLTGAKFNKNQYLPKDGVAVTLWKDRDSAWKDVVKGIEKVIAELTKDAESN